MKDHRQPMKVFNGCKSHKFEGNVSSSARIGSWPTLSSREYDMREIHFTEQ